MRERNSSRCYFEIVPNRERTTLLSIILRHVRPGSVIFSDNWSAYNDIGRLEEFRVNIFLVKKIYFFFISIIELNLIKFKHEFVNHSLYFVKPNTNVHTNGIESLWNSCKRRFKSMCGCSRGFLQAYLNEFCWRNNFNNKEQIFFSVVKAIGIKINLLKTNVSIFSI